MVVTKILETTLSAGNTSVSFTDTDIPNSLIRVFTSNPDIIPVSRTLSGNTLTVTFEAQTNNIDVALEMVKAGLDIVDNLTSTDTDKALSANQGKVLKDDIDTVSGNLSSLSDIVNNLDIPDDITDLDDVNVTSIQDGQVLAWNEDASKFVNVNQSGGSSSDDYSTSETVIGKWIDDSSLYRRVFDLGSDTSISNSQWVISGITITNLNKIIKAMSVNSTGTFYPLNAYHTSGNVNLLACRDGNPATSRWIILEYTKTA